MPSRRLNDSDDDYDDVVMSDAWENKKTALCYDAEIMNLDRSSILFASLHCRGSLCTRIWRSKSRGKTGEKVKMRLKHIDADTRRTFKRDQH